MSEVQTICFHTRDAVEQHDSSFTFAMPANRNKMSSAKVALASCEFPMMQWTIETDWCKLWLNEGVRLDSSNNFIEFVTRSPNGNECDVPLRLCVPPRLNRISKMTKQNGVLRIECEAEHGLLSTNVQSANASDSSRPSSGDRTKCCAIKSFRLIGGRHGDIVVDLADVVVAVDAKVFVLNVDNAQYVDGATHVLMPTISTPSDLCDMLSTCAQRLLTTSQETRDRQAEVYNKRDMHQYDISRLEFAYNVENDLVRVSVVVPHRGTVVRILPSMLARLCGISTMPLRMTSTTSTWPCEPTLFWDFVELPTGFYGPCHRPMCVGQPLRFCPEVEAAVNRLYFPLPAQPSTAHLLVFTDPAGNILTCTIPPGRYSPSSLCRHLEHSMLQCILDIDPRVSFSVQYNDDFRFVFQCERATTNGKYRPAPFSMLFNHPMSIDASRLGFPQQPLCGSATYVSAIRCKVATVDRTSSRCVANILRVSEIVSQKRFRFHGVAVPPMIGVFVARGNGVVAMKTFVNGHPFAHGLQAGDAVRLVVGRQKNGTVQLQEGEVTIDVAEASTSIDCGHTADDFTCLVLDSHDDDDVCIVNVEVPSNIFGVAGTFVRIAVDVEPWSMHFAKPATIPPALLGFSRSAVLWGRDGTIEDDHGMLLPPFDAPHAHCLDHPDYILITFSESAGSSFIHSYNGENKSIFCKLSLYPQFREERMLPRDTTLMRSGLNRFSISFWNPDMRTPYRFHGAQFSFSLNFICTSYGLSDGM